MNVKIILTYAEKMPCVLILKAVSSAYATVDTLVMAPAVKVNYYRAF